MGPTSKDDLEIGYVSGVFGTSGELKVYLHNPESTLFKKPLNCLLRDASGNNRESCLVVRKGAGKRILGRFTTVSTRNEAEAINGHKIFVQRGLLPELSPDEFYISDLLGLDVCFGETRYGKVTGVHETVRGDMLEILCDDEVDFIPLLEAFIANVDVDDGRVWLTAVGAEAL